MNTKYKFRSTAPDFKRIVEENPTANAVLVVAGPDKNESVLILRADSDQAWAAADRAKVDCHVGIGLPATPRAGFANGSPTWWMNSGGEHANGFCYCCHATPANLRRVAQALAEEPNRACSVEVIW